MKNWLKGQLALAVLSLCVLVVFVPELGEAASNVPAPVSIASSNLNYAVLPIPFRVESHLWAAKRGKSSLHWTVSIDNSLLSPWTYGYFAPNPNTSTPYVSQVGFIPHQRFQSICRLLDIPPPSLLVS